MTRVFNVVAVSGSTSAPSRTLALAEAVVAALAQRLTLRSRTIDLGEFARELGAALARHELPAVAERALQAIESADLLVVATPVYRGAYPGHLKHLFDLVGQDALIDVPVLLAATGGSPRHALVIDHQLRPLFGFFQSLTLPVGVYGSAEDFSDHRVASAALLERVQLAAERAAGVLVPQDKSLQAAA